ncbi:phosphotransferase [Actinomadura graeca]|uniref:Phosphotransferase n=1 Tax=Actinomadura graeca TaxID=2750812 RepID=A0ABX8R359_9ACTN|nr:phosphotransferase [Actinomadura graeca]QXJ24397.1 phosphotransferase [Actinomadura graeca]
MHKLQWDDLSDAARNAIEARCGAVLKAESAERGIMPGVAARLDTECRESAFLKAIPRDGPAVRLHLRERAANLGMADGVPAPPMLWSGEAGGWLLLLFHFVDGGRSADLSPGSRDLPGVLDAVSRIEGSGGVLPPVSVNLEMLKKTAAAFLAEGLGGSRRGTYAEALDALPWAALEGDELLHYDLHSGNLLATGRETFVIDWSFACRGARWVDAALLAPRLVEAGHTPARAEALVAGLPTWDAAPAEAVTGLAALWTMFREYKALYGPREHRGFRTRAAEAGWAWLRHLARW